MSSKFGNIPDKQKALVLQGGGALGAYEAGVFRAIYKKLIKEINPDKNNLFDIIAGTSSGALSGAVLINHVLAHKSWKDSDIKLVNFWKGLRSTTIADALIKEYPYGHAFWKFLHYINPDIANPEAARRFWSVLQFDFNSLPFVGGVPNAYQPIPQLNWRFLSPYLDYRWLRYNYAPLRRYLSNSIDFPIKTEEGEPRLLTVSTDVQDYTSAVTFDSYKKPKDPNNVADNRTTHHQGKVSNWYSEYGEGQNKHLIFYDGIGLDQLIASALAKYALDHPYMEDRISKTKRQFWDGGYLSNTPLRELIQSHRDYWLNRSDRKLGVDDELKKVPDLEVYIVDLHATIEKNIPRDVDSIDDREHDILFRNKTSYDEKVAKLITDYVSLTRSLIKLAKDKGASDSDIDSILDSKDKDKDTQPTSTRRSGEARMFRDLLDGRFKITKIWHIERDDDPDAIYGKFTDFSSESIDKLIEDGEHDAKLVIH